MLYLALSASFVEILAPIMVGDVTLRLSAKKGFQGQPGASRQGGRSSREQLRGSGTSCAAPSLRFSPRDRWCAEILGRAQGPFAQSIRQTPGGSDRRPPARIWQVPRGNSGGPLRRGRGENLG